MQSEPYIQTLKQWCDEINVQWPEIKAALSEKLTEQQIEEWEKEFRIFQASLGSSYFHRNSSTLYGQANELYLLLERYSQELSESRQFREFQQNPEAVPIGQHKLPALPYSYDALEPYISEEIMRLHHTKHHQSYITGLNNAELEMKKARESGNFTLIKHWEREAAFHGAGHYLHTIFWFIMSPGGSTPGGQMLKALTSSFGSFDSFKQHFTEAAKNVEGSGWALAVWSPRSRRLEILNAEKHQNLSQWDVVPLLVLDVWEHAYYLQYKNDRAKYIENWWNVVNWREVEIRYNTAKKIKWQPY
ncbi:superoxide dismutase [Metabacillus sp. RGM 3146]|uniref:superoxide dismutase n=1 Tax=Metabacillus sp. RGM 3146 TaxID=3401092 RepID=UPI003B999E85